MVQRSGSTEQRSKFVKTGVAAAMLSVSRNTVRAAFLRGDLPGIKLGAQILVSRAALERLVASAID